MPDTRPLIYLTAGEPSGDQIGARLMQALREELHGQVDFAGVGGARMEAEGLQSLFPMSELTFMGLDFLPSLRRIFRRIRETVDDVTARQPAAVVTIDAQGYSAQVGRRLRPRLKRPIIHFGAPTVWAYKPGRAGKVARYLDRLLCIFPFEPPYFEKHGLETTFVGHPAAEARFMPPADGAALRERLGIPQDAPVLATLPGSRTAEIRRLMPVFTEVVGHLSPRLPGLQCLLPTVPGVADQVEAAVAAWPCPVHVFRGAQEKYAAFEAADAALATSGTVTVETSFAGLPTVVVYRMNEALAQLNRVFRVVQIDYASAVNLVMDQPVLPEFLQWGLRADRIAPVLEPLFRDGPDRRKMLDLMTQGTERLVAGDQPPRTVAARAILDEIERYPAGRRAG